MKKKRCEHSGRVVEMASWFVIARGQPGPYRIAMDWGDIIAFVLDLFVDVDGLRFWRFGQTSTNLST